VIETPAQQAALVDSLERAGGGDQPALPIDEPAAEDAAVAVAVEEAQTVPTTPAEEQQPEVRQAVADEASPGMAPEPGDAVSLDERGEDAEPPAPTEAQAPADTEPTEEPRIDPDAPPPDATDPDAVLPGKTS